MIDLTKKKLLTPTTCTRKGKPQGRAVTAAVASLLRWTAPAALLAASLTAQAGMDCTATLMATLNGQPAFKPVTWVITDNRSGDTVFTMQRHTGIAHIPCGDYTATVTLGDLTRSRVFRLIFTSDVIINMGN